MNHPELAYLLFKGYSFSNRHENQQLKNCLWKGVPCIMEDTVEELEAIWNASFKAAPHKYFESVDHGHTGFMLCAFTAVHIFYMATAAVA